MRCRSPLPLIARAPRRETVRLPLTCRLAPAHNRSCNHALYTAWPEMVGCASADECLCLKHQFCIKGGVEPFPIAVTSGEKAKENDNICEIQLFCCTYALKVPQVICRGVGQCFCCAGNMALPPTDDVPMTCGFCFLGLYPKVVFAKTLAELTSKGAAPTGEEMAR